MSKLSEGAPLSYDYFKGIEEDITALKRSINNLQRQNRADDDQGPTIKMRGGKGAFVNAKNVTVIVDKVGLLENDKAVIESSIIFDGGIKFASSPVVVANLLNSSKGDNDQSPPYAVLTVGNITNTGFDYRIQMIKGAATNKRTLLINYIAIGKTSSS
jgi:hypothetical protein